MVPKLLVPPTIMWAAVVSAAASDSDDVISVAGLWRFSLDRNDVGVKERWFDRKLTESVKLPGSLAENGIGDDISVDTKWTGGIVDRSFFTDKRYEKYRKPGNVKVPFWLTPVKHYVGPAWYQKDVEIPQTWKDMHVTLSLERCHWETRLWVDGREVGTCNSLTTPHEYDLGPLRSGKHVLTLRVDNTPKIDVGVNAHSISDHTQTNWNGIIGRIELRAADRVWIRHVWIRPDVAGRKVLVRLRVGNLTGGRTQGTVLLNARTSNTAALHTAAPRSQPIGVPAGQSDFEIEYPLGPDALLWDEFAPAVYNLNVSLEAAVGGQTLRDEKFVTFGLREFKPAGTRFTLNGRPVFLRGTLECTIFPLTGYPPTNVDEWRRIYRICRSHGLNHMRFHSNCPPEAAFVAADLEGFLLQVEGPHWTAVGDGKPIDAYVYAETDRILKTYGNHPSFVMMNYGNEPAGANQKRFFGDLIRHWKSTDGRHVYTGAAGWPQIPENDYHITPAPRIHAWGAALASRINAKPPETMTDYRDHVAKSPVPIVSHEIGQWCVFPNFKEISKYTGVTRACNFEIFRDFLTENHMADQAEAFLMASGKLQTLCYKEEIESALRTPGFGGFQLLDLHDFPGQGTALVGVLDAFWGEKGYVSPAEYRRFAGPTVPLARMPKRILTSDETFTANAEVAHFGPAPLKDARLHWTVTSAGGKTVSSDDWPGLTIPIGNGTWLGSIAVSLKDITKAQKLNLTISIDGTDAANDWDFWVYPAKVDLTPGPVQIVNALDDKAQATLKAGGKVMLIPGPKTARPDRYGRIPPGFSSIFWNTAWTGRQAPHTLGILCDPNHPAFADFPTEYHSNWQWWELVSRSQAMILDSLPPQFRPLVQVVDDWFTCRRLGLVFEANVGGGKLLVCGIDLQSDLERRPVARQMLHSLLKYMNSDAFNPKAELGLAAIRELFVPAPTMAALDAKVVKVDSEAPGYPAANVIDADPRTFWHTPWEPTTPDYPHEIQIDLGKAVQLKGFRYLPRQDMPNGRVSEYAFYVSQGGKAWGEPVARGKFPRNPDEKLVMFDRPCQGRFVRFVALAGFSREKFVSMAELDVILTDNP